MIDTRIYPQHWYDAILGYVFRIAAAGVLPASWFRPPLPPETQRRTVTASPTLEIVSHCWQYAHMLIYQISSFVNYPPSDLKVVVTVFYADEDAATKELLAFFEKQTVPNVEWNWQPLPRGQLFRRGIGRNRAALSTTADWIWMTDCDIVFHDGCLDALAGQIRGRRDTLLFPREERTTTMLAESSPLLRKDRTPHVVDIDTDSFEPHTRDRAKGAFQIIHGDVARAIGYCGGIPLYQTPASHWCKCYEDRAFRWLVGTQGEPIDVGGVYQIRHIEKGRYRKGSAWSALRSKIRRMQE